ncbi:MAG TPA: hypothetical protein VNJ01_00385 [Bacteriovoracaceae bacterium]|nr:hypothetical protein [Bacteriovoracaceae bacterium]
MKFLILILTLFLLACTHPSSKAFDEKITKIQNVWETKDPKLAHQYFPEIEKLEETRDDYTLGTGKPGLPTFGIRVSKKDLKITRISYWLTDKDNNNADYIKVKLVADDWISNPVKSSSAHVIEKRVSLSSKKLGVSFIYDEYDPQKKVWIVYWGADPKKINL